MSARMSSIARSLGIDLATCQNKPTRFRNDPGLAKGVNLEAQKPKGKGQKKEVISSTRYGS